MLNNLSDAQFSRTSANTSDRSTNGQSASSTTGTTTQITVKGSAPSISTRSS